MLELKTSHGGTWVWVPYCSRWDRFLGMTAAMTQNLSPRLPQFIEQVLRIDTLELTVLHLAQLPEGMINLGKRLLLRRGSRAHFGKKHAKSCLHHEILECVYSSLFCAVCDCPTGGDAIRSFWPCLHTGSLNECSLLCNLIEPKIQATFSTDICGQALHVVERRALVEHRAIAMICKRCRR